MTLGSGSGMALYMLRGLGYEDVKGLDFSPECVRCAQMVNLPVCQADAIQWLRDSTERFDVILAIDLLEHLTDDGVMSVLTEAHKHLAANGVFIAQTVNGESPMFGQIRYGDFTRRNAFTRQSLSALLTQAGFTEPYFRPVDPYPHGSMSASRGRVETPREWTEDVECHRNRPRRQWYLHARSDLRCTQVVEPDCLQQ